MIEGHEYTVWAEENDCIIMLPCEGSLHNIIFADRDSQAAVIRVLEYNLHHFLVQTPGPHLEDCRRRRGLAPVGFN